MFPELWKDNTVVWYKAEHTLNSHFCFQYFEHLCNYCLPCKQKHLWPRLRAVLIYGYKYLESRLTPLTSCPFSNTIVGPPLGSMTFSSMGTGQLYSAGYDLLCTMGLKSHQKAAGYPYSNDFLFQGSIVFYIGKIKLLEMFVFSKTALTTGTITVNFVYWPRHGTQCFCLQLLQLLQIVQNFPDFL